MPCPNACPDEEGIKTGVLSHLGGRGFVRTLALTKKGLRLRVHVELRPRLGPNACPDEEGIKTREHGRQFGFGVGSERLP